MDESCFSKIIYCENEWFVYDRQSSLYKKESIHNIVFFIKSILESKMAHFDLSNIYLTLLEFSETRNSKVNDLTIQIPLLAGVSFDKNTREIFKRTSKDFYTRSLNVRHINSVQVDIYLSLLEYFRQLTYGKESDLIKCCSSIFRPNTQFRHVLFKTGANLYLQIILESILGAYCYTFSEESKILTYPLLLISNVYERRIPITLMPYKGSYWLITNKSFNQNLDIISFEINENIDANDLFGTFHFQDILDVAFSIFTS